MRLFSVQVITLVTVAFATTQKRKKQKVGADIALKDTYHPWDQDHERNVELTPQHMIGEHMLKTIKEGDCLDTSINILESFSTANHLGMTLGNEKGKIIEDAIATLDIRTNDIVFLEFGSHVGDGTLRITRQLLTKARDSGRRCLVFSLEKNQEWLGIGTSLVRHVLGMAKETACRYIPLALTNDISHIVDVIKSEFNVGSLSGVFLDHDHSKFMRDVNILHEKRLLEVGTLILADNALRHKNLMAPFIEEMKRIGRNLQLVDTSDPYPDQILIVEWAKPKPVTKHDSDEL
jgi:predicted O-methyltransferase YrrM